MVCVPDDGIVICALDDGKVVCAPNDGPLICALKDPLYRIFVLIQELDFVHMLGTDEVIAVVGDII
jgi:hypothetical protein